MIGNENIESDYIYLGFIIQQEEYTNENTINKIKNGWSKWREVFVIFCAKFYKIVKLPVIFINVS